MPFMERQVTPRMKWYQYDSPRDGVMSYPAGTFTKSDIAAMHDKTDACYDDTTKVEEVYGYGARLSAPGYMDCTEWTVFDTEVEAEDFLTQMYGDE